MSSDDSAWVKETSTVLGEEEQTSPFQITMPYVVLQIMQRLEPNHSVQVSAASTAGAYHFIKPNSYHFSLVGQCLENLLPSD